MDKNNEVCPNCGHCPTCGRSAQPIYPYPLSPWYPMYPGGWWGITSPNIGVGGTSTTSGSGGYSYRLTLAPQTAAVTVTQ